MSLPGGQLTNASRALLLIILAHSTGHSKAGLSMMSKLLAVRLGEIGIPVYEVRPGVIETDMTAGVKEIYDKKLKEGIFLESRIGKPEDIGKIVSTLVSGDIPYSTGQVLTPDGGMTLQRI